MYIRIAQSFQHADGLRQDVRLQGTVALCAQVRGLRRIEEIELGMLRLCG